MLQDKLKKNVAVLPDLYQAIPQWTPFIIRFQMESWPICQYSIVHKFVTMISFVENLKFTFFTVL